MVNLRVASSTWSNVGGGGAEEATVNICEVEWVICGRLLVLSLSREWLLSKERELATELTEEVEKSPPSLVVLILIGS